IYGNLLGFNDAEKLPADEETVICRAVRGWKFFDRVAVQRREIEPIAVTDDLPSRLKRAQTRIDPLLSGLPFGLVHTLELSPTNSGALIGDVYRISVALSKC